jgi:hypothetical protein
MLQKMTNSSAVWLLTGLVLGVGIALLLQGQPAQATATDHADDFAIATGHVTADLEAVYLLDFKTGSLLGSVMNKQTGEFQNFYKRELAADFDLKGKAKPKFLMVTGAMQSARAQVPIYHVLYVAELNSGKLAAYAMPYRGEQSVRGGSTAEMMFLHYMSFRQLPQQRAQ